MTRRCTHRIVRELHIDFDMESLTDDELETIVRVCDSSMGAALAARNICNQRRNETCR